MIIINQTGDAFYNTDNMVCIRQGMREPKYGDYYIEFVSTAGVYTLGVYNSQTAMKAEFSNLMQAIINHTITPSCYLRYKIGGTS